MSNSQTLSSPQPRMTAKQLLKRAATFLLLTVLATISLWWLAHQPMMTPAPLFLLSLMAVVTLLSSLVATLVCLTLAAARSLKNL